MMNENVMEKAVQYKHEGNNCAQAVTKALLEALDKDSEILKNLAAGFGVGMGGMEATCGAVVGANMIAGILTEGKGTMLKSKQILSEFEELSGATICKVLKGKDTGIVICDCDNCVRNAVQAAMDVLENYFEG